MWFWCSSPDYVTIPIRRRLRNTRSHATSTNPNRDSPPKNLNESGGGCRIKPVLSPITHTHTHSGRAYHIRNVFFSLSHLRVFAYHLRACARVEKALATIRHTHDCNRTTRGAAPPLCALAFLALCARFARHSVMPIFMYI